MIKNIEIPVKLPIKYTHCSIILDEPLTIIDPGVKGQQTIDIISDELKKHGRSIEQVERVLLTHGHIDHFGACEDIRKISGATVFVHKNDFEKSSKTEEKDGNFSTTYKNTLLEYGCPESGLTGIDNFLTYILPLYDPLTQAEHYSKDIIDFKNINLSVIETPGHTSGSVCFYEQESKTLISGDTLIKEISPNPVMEFLENGERFHSVQSFRDSMEKLSKYEYSKIIAGHGDNITDFDKVYENYKLEWAKIENTFLKCIEKRKIMSAYEMMIEVYGELEEFEVFFGMSEMIGYFDFFETKGTIKYIEENGIIKGEYIGS